MENVEIMFFIAERINGLCTFLMFSVASAITILRVVNGWIGAIILKTTHTNRARFLLLWQVYIFKGIILFPWGGKGTR